MRLSVRWSILAVAGLIVGSISSIGPAAPPKFADAAPDGKSEPKAYLNVKAKLTDDDPADPKIVGSVQKVHEIGFEAGKTYRIDMTSRDLDSFLRLEDPDGKTVAEDEGGDLQIRDTEQNTLDDLVRRLVSVFGP